ncbi:MAG: hypothetical protein R3F23_08715 [Verrucomicrobiia bacterium]
MKISLHLLILKLFFLSFISLWGYERQPYFDFIKQSLLKLEKPDITQIWSFPEIKQPQGGYLRRFTFDITGDGIDELFLNSSALVDRFDSGSWNIYQKVGNQYKNIASIPLHGNFSIRFYKEGGKTHVQYIWGRDRWLKEYVLYTYTIDSKGNFVTTEEKIDRSEEDVKNGIYPIEEKDLKAQKIFEPKLVERILLADFLRDPQNKWHLMHFTDFDLSQLGKRKNLRKGRSRL